MRIACSTACFPRDRPEAALARIAWAGYDLAELAPGDEEQLDEAGLRQRLRAEELELAAVFAGSLPAGEPPAAEALGHTGRSAALARALDCSVCVLRAPADGTPEGLIAALRLLDRALGALPVDLCLVNRNGTLLAAREALQDLWRRGLPERVGLALDPAQALLAGWDPVDLDSLPELPRHVYLTDARAGRVVPSGEGDLDNEGLAAALRLRGYGGRVSLLLENADPWAVEPLARELRDLAAVWFRS